MLMLQHRKRKTPVLFLVVKRLLIQYIQMICSIALLVLFINIIGKITRRHNFIQWKPYNVITDNVFIWLMGTNRLGQ